MRSIGLKIAVAAGLAMAGAAGVLAASSAPAPNTPARIEKTDDGDLLVTPAGMTLYTFQLDDTRPGKSQCSNVAVKGFPDPTAGFGEYPLPHADTRKSCIEKWPPFLANPNATPIGDFGQIDRAEGGKQWTFRGHPLYTSVKDHVPGDRNGAFVIGQINNRAAWQLAVVPLDALPGLRLMRREEGLTLATANGRPVYTPHGPRLEKVCDNCADEVFKPLLAPAAAKIGGDWSIVDAGAGRYQYAFKTRPLFAAPDSMTNWQIAEAGGWDPVVFRKTAGTPHEIGKHASLIGDVYTDKSGKTLYAFTCGALVADSVRCDDPGDAAQYWVVLCGLPQECARRWHPYEAPAHAKPVGDWSVVDVAYPMFTDPVGFTYPPDAPRVKAWAYRGMPLYTYYQDKDPGDIWGHGVRLFAFSGFYALQVPGRGVND